MQILIVEGNTSQASLRLQQAGLDPYAHAYAGVLRSLMPEAVCEFAYPCESGIANADQVTELPKGRVLTDYDGIVWTGSSLCITDGEQPAVAAQLALAQLAWKSGVPVFGSCWGMQIMTVALGGRVSRSGNGREIGISRNIQLTEAGREHPMYQGKAVSFDALASHRDVVIAMPPDTQLLAGNFHSPIQAISIERDGNSFWGVQYHPEFDLQVIATLIELRGSELLAENFFNTQSEVKQYVQKLRTMYLRPEKRAPLAWQLGISAEVMDPANRHRELHNWLAHCLARVS